MTYDDLFQMLKKLPAEDLKQDAFVYDPLEREAKPVAGFSLVGRLNAEHNKELREAGFDADALVLTVDF